MRKVRCVAGLAVSAMAACPFDMALAESQREAEGFFEGSNLNAKTRVLYMNRDYRNGASNNGGESGYREDSGVSQLFVFSSGFTQGTVGFGLDGYVMGSFRLDGGAGRSGNGLFANNSDGSPETTQSAIGGAVKLRVSDTVLKYGNQFINSPVFSTDDGRLLPEVATGIWAVSNEFENLELSAGRLTALRSQTGQWNDSVNGRDSDTGLKQPGLTSADVIGATYTVNDQLSVTLAASDVDDYFERQYVNVNYAFSLSDRDSLTLDFNGYNTRGQGKELAFGAGDTPGVDNKIWSFSTAYQSGAHTLTVAFQHSSGDNAYYYGVDGGGTVFLANAAQISDFIGRDERSWQARYDLDLASYGIPGLSVMGRYISGDNITTVSGAEGKEKELDLEARYVVQEGPAKDLSLRLRQAVYRTNRPYEFYSSDVNEIRLIAEYPINIF